MKEPTPEAQLVDFQTPLEWETWLKTNYSLYEGVWFRIYKKSSPIQGVSYKEALDIALCYGWIDGQVKKYDEHSYIQRFTPRRKKSMWSKINRDNVARLESAGRMQEPGRAAINAAKADGRWDAAYDSPTNATIPEDFARALQANRKALAFYNTLNKSNTYAIIWRLQTATSPHIRTKRIQQIIEKLTQGKSFHP